MVSQRERGYVKKGRVCRRTGGKGIGTGKCTHVQTTQSCWGNWDGPVGTQCLIIRSLPFMKEEISRGQEVSSIHSHQAFVEHELGHDRWREGTLSNCPSSNLTWNKLSTFSFTKGQKPGRVFYIQ